MADISVRLSAVASSMAPCDDSVLVVMKDKGLRLHRPADRDREWLVKLNSNVTAACAHKYGSVVAANRYVAVLDKEHVVTWGAGFNKALHLASGIHVGHEVTHVLPPQTGDKPFHTTQGVLVVGGGALFVFNPYTTEVAGPLPGLSADGGDVIWARAGVEGEDETFYAYIVTQAAPETLKILRVSPRSYSVEVVGTQALPAGVAALDVVGDTHWVAVTQDGKVHESAVRDPITAEGTFFTWRALQLPLEQRLAGSGLAKSVVSVAATDPHVIGVAVASANPAAAYDGVRLFTLDLRFLTVLEDASPLQQPDEPPAHANPSLVYAACAGTHWLGIGDAVYASTAALGVRTLAGAMKQGKQAVSKAQPVVFKVDLGKGDVKAAFEKAANAAAKLAAKPAAVPTKEPEAVSKLSGPLAVTVLSAPTTVRTWIAAAVEKRWWALLEALVAAADEGKYVFGHDAALVALAKLACDKSAKPADQRAAAKAFQRCARAQRTPLAPAAYGAIAYAFAKDAVTETAALKQVYASFDALFGMPAPLPSELETALELTDALPESARVRVLKYLNARLVVRVGCSKAGVLDEGGVPSSKALTHFAAALLEGSADDLPAASPAYTTELHKASTLLSYVVEVGQHVRALPGQLTALLGMPGARSAAAPDIDARTYLPGPLKVKHASQAVQRHTVVL